MSWLFVLMFALVTTAVTGAAVTREPGWFAWAIDTARPLPARAG